MPPRMRWCDMAARDTMLANGASNASLATYSIRTFIYISEEKLCRSFYSTVTPPVSLELKRNLKSQLLSHPKRFLKFVVDQLPTEFVVFRFIVHTAPTISKISPPGSRFFSTGSPLNGSRQKLAPPTWNSSVSFAGGILASRPPPSSKIQSNHQMSKSRPAYRTPVP